MTKPISEYTLNEVMEICKNSFDCDKCRFFRAGCRLSNIPPKWDLHEKIFSMAERERADAIKTPFPDAATLRNVGGTIYVLSPSEDVLLKLPEDKFKSIERGRGEYILTILGAF